MSKEVKHHLKGLEFKDRCLKSLDKFIELIEQEHKNQIELFGIQKATASEWLSWTLEEFGELAKAVNDYIYFNGPHEAIRQEGIQVVTLVLKLIDAIRLTPLVK